MEKRERTIELMRKYLQEAANERGINNLEGRVLHGFDLVHVGRGSILCNLPITDRVLDGEGKWSVGAMSIVMDIFGPVVAYTFDGRPHVTVSFNASFSSTAKLHEEVELEGKVVGRKGDLKLAIMAIRRKDGADLIATGRLWCVPLNVNLKRNSSDFVVKL